MGKISNAYTTNTTNFTVGNEVYKISDSVSNINTGYIDNSFVMSAPLEQIYAHAYPSTKTPDSIKNSLWSFDVANKIYTITLPEYEISPSFALGYCFNSAHINNNADNTVYQIDKQIYNWTNASEISNIKILNPVDLRKILLCPQVNYYPSNSDSLQTCDIKYLLEHSPLTTDKSDNWIYPVNVNFKTYVWNGEKYVLDDNTRYITPVLCGYDYIVPFETFVNQKVGVAQFGDLQYKEFREPFYSVYLNDNPISYGKFGKELIVNYSANTKGIIADVDSTDYDTKYFVYADSYRSMLSLIKRSDYIIKALAHCGCYLIGDNYNLTNKTLKTMWNDDNIWLGEMVAGGYTTGNLIQGKNIPSSNTINKNDFTTDTDYDPNAPKPVDDNDKYTDMEIGNIYSVGGFVNYYKITSENLKKLSNLMSNVDVVGSKNLLPNLISLKAFALDFDKMARGTVETIKIGGVEMTDDIAGTATGTTIDATYSYIHCFDYVVKGKYGDLSSPHFMDFAPYTTIELILPMGGVVVLPDSVMYTQLSCDYLFDIVSGTAIGVVKSNNSVIATVPCTISQDIPFSTNNVASKTAAMINNISNVTKSLMSLTPNSLIDTGTNVIQTIFDNNANYIEKIGKQGDFCDFGLPKNAYIKYTRPIDLTPNNYGKTTGFLCNKKIKLNECKGYTICSNVDINVSATNAEKQMIKQLLETGVYI